MIYELIQTDGKKYFNGIGTELTDILSVVEDTWKDERVWCLYADGVNHPKFEWDPNA